MSCKDHYNRANDQKMGRKSPDRDLPWVAPPNTLSQLLLFYVFPPEMCLHNIMSSSTTFSKSDKGKRTVFAEVPSLEKHISNLSPWRLNKKKKKKKNKRQ
jgi:hypothetical protein